MGGAGERLARAHAVAQLSAKIRRCARCSPAAHRTLGVAGKGNALSHVMRVGEAPRGQGDVTGRRTLHAPVRRAGAGQPAPPMYHPAAALHQASLRDTLFGDIRSLPAALPAARATLSTEREPSVRGTEPITATAATEGRPDDAEQMTLS